MAQEGSLRTTFDEVARVYDEVRPGYPEPLVEDLITLSGIPRDGSILEVGCGTGQATLPFARRGYAMHCLELGPNLAALAAEHCRPYSNVVVENVSFEEWPLRLGQFDLVLSAAAFHWIPPDVGYPKAAAALQDGGSLALLWNDHQGGDGPFFEAAQQVRRDVAMLAIDPANDRPLDARLREQESAIEASGLFGPVSVRRYP
jgi:SAM-dependent methyltransferase